MDYISKENEKIVNELLDSKKVKAGQSINYTQFLELYEPYKNEMSEKEFAYILEVNDTNYNNMKSCNKGMRVLKNKKSDIIENTTKEVIDTLFELNKIKAGQVINYTYFLELYKPYKDKITEKDFAQILEISMSSYRNMKNRRKKGRSIKE